MEYLYADKFALRTGYFYEDDSKAQNQSEWINYLIGLKPVRILFNPGTENPLFFQKATEAGIDVQNVCTLVMLTTGQF